MRTFFEKKIKLNKRWGKKILSYFGILLFCGLSFLFLSTQTYNILSVALFSLLFLAAIVLFMGVNKIRYFSFVGVFIFLLYIFNFGIPISAFFSYSLTKPNMVNSYLYWLSFAYSPYVELDVLSNSYIFTAFFISFLLIGLSLGYEVRQKCRFFKSGKLDSIKNIFSANDDKRYITFAIILAAVSWPPFLINLISDFALFISGGYLATYKNSLPGFISTLASLFYVSMLVFIVYFKSKKMESRKHKLLFYLFGSISMLFCLLEMLKGTRYHQSIYILVFIFLMVEDLLKNMKKKTKWILSICTIVLGLFALYFLSYISAHRNSGNISISHFFRFVIDNGVGSVIVKLLIEFGSSIKSTQLAMQFIPSYNDYFYGFTYISSFASIYPNVFNLYGDFVKNYTFTLFFPDFTTYAIGGNMIGEAFFNFGYFISMPFALLIGFFISKVHLLLNIATERKQPFIHVLSLMCFVSLFSWIRGFFCSFIFTFFVLLAIYFSTHLFFKRKQKFNSSKNNIENDFWSIDL